MLAQLKQINWKDHIPLIIVIIALVIYTIRVSRVWEGYDEYYMWRAFGPKNSDEMSEYPWKLQPHAHFARFDYYPPGFFEKGYGHL